MRRESAFFLLQAPSLKVLATRTFNPLPYVLRNWLAQALACAPPEYLLVRKLSQFRTLGIRRRPEEARRTYPWMTAL